VAGTLFSLALSQQLNNQGKPLLNAPLYVYEANTSTPANTYEDFGLTILNPWPLRTDGAGRFPPFWVEDGAYRARFTDAAGAVVYFDIPYVQALGPSITEGEGGGGGSVDANAIFQTGDTKWRPISGTLSGWVRMNARTIGSATSGATERANADTQPLYEYLWNNFSNALCPVQGGRGGSAASDYAANKTIGLINMRGRGPLGLDDMGNTAEGVITEGTPLVAASSGGAEKTSIPIAKENLPNYTLPNTLGINLTNNTQLRRGGGFDLAGGVASGGYVKDAPQATLTASITGGVTLGGSGTAISRTTISPYRLGTWFIRL
jgi:hypothetical protein